ncbi:MAG TPA: hypothetical protein VHE80_01115 [Acidimicrobiales bacterium]|nr:hypothetical protein [Acidimicrobiales bacterium]
MKGEGRERERQDGHGPAAAPGDRHAPEEQYEQGGGLGVPDAATWLGRGDPAADVDAEEDGRQQPVDEHRGRPA